MALAAQNIVLTGGNVKFSNFEERFLSEVRPLVPDICPVNVS
jgi:actin-related protein